MKEINMQNKDVDKGDFDRIIAGCTEAIRLDPNNAKGDKERGKAYFKKEDYDRAIADFTEVTNIYKSIHT
jgi:tetratricopeptide (TPR) repeat protein